MSIALEGAKEVEKQAKKILSNALYEALKLFGLDKVVKDLLKSANKGINKLLNKANLNLPIDIKALDTLDVKFDQFLDDLDGLEFVIDLEIPKMELDNFDIMVFQESLDICGSNKRKENMY